MAIIATDLDGTLLNNNNEISEENTKAIHYAEEKGVEVVIATGRAYFDAKSICEKAGITPYIIGSNGAVTYSKTGEQLADYSVPDHLYSELVTWLDQNDYYYEVYTEDSIYVHKKRRNQIEEEIATVKEQNKQTDKEKHLLEMEKQLDQTGYVLKDNVEDLLEEVQVVYNIAVWSTEEDKLQKLWTKYKERNTFSIVSSAKYNYEMMSEGVSKGNAIKQLTTLLRLPLSYSIGIGDSHNDVSMFQVVEYSVAMEEASEEIKKHCTTTTSTNEEHGVAKAIYSHIDKILLNV